MNTLNDLKQFAKKQSRLNGLDYSGYVQGYRSDRYQITKARKQCEKSVRFKFGTEELIDGNYFNGRLVIKNNKIDYTPGQYAPTEIYWAVLDYLNKTNEV